MALQPYALASLAAFKSTVNAGGTAKDEQIERALNTASRLIEAELGRRLRYRAPEEVAGAANIVASVAIATGSLTVAAQPSASRTLIVSVTDRDRSITAGTLTITGTVAGTAGSTETFDLSDGQSRYHGRKFFTAVSAAALTGVVGASSSDLITVGTSLGMVEYHDPGGSCRIRLGEWPVYAFAEINEDSNRDYASTTALDLTDDYEYSVRGVVTRVDSNSQPMAFESGYRAIKVRYSAGYGALSTIPPDLQDVCIRLAALGYKEYERGSLGQSAVSDQLGNFTRFSSSQITPEMRDALAEYRRPDIFTTTVERDFDEEAT